MPDSRKLLPSAATIISLIVMTTSGIWAGSKIDTKADIAYKFVEQNRALPQKVCTLEKEMEKVKRTVEAFDVMQMEQRHIIQDMRELNAAVVKALEKNGYSN